MKKIYMLLLGLAATAMMTSAQNPTLLWANNFNYQNDGGAMLANIGYNITMAADGNLFVFNDCGTTLDSQIITFGDQQVGIGTNHGSTSYNHSMVLVKANALTGEPIWSVYSTVGDGASNNGLVAATSDGGAYIVAKLRHTNGQETNKIEFVDATGNHTTLDWELTDANRFYQVAILKIDANGAIKWYKMINVDNAPVPDATTTYTSDAIALGDIAVDDNGNLYVGGRFTTSISFENGPTYTSQSSEGWNGSVQTTRGDLFIAKFDENGDFMDCLVQQGVTTSANIAALTAHQGKIYFAGYTESINTLMLGNIELAAGLGENYRDLLVGCMDTDLNVEWAKTFADDYKGAIYNKLAINVIGDNMWVSGKVRTSISDDQGNSFVSTTNMRDGMLLCLNKQDGSWLKATAYGTNQSGFNGVFQAKDDDESLYAYGHTLMGNFFIQQYNIEDLTAGEQWILWNNSMDIQNYSAVCDENTIYLMGRVAKGTTNVYYGTEDYTLTNTIGMNEVVAAFTLPFYINNGDNDTEFVLGDVDNNGYANIEDVTLLIDYLLGNMPEVFNEAAADVDADGFVTISDVTALIDYLLTLK